MASARTPNTFHPAAWLWLLLTGLLCLLGLSAPGIARAGATPGDQPPVFVGKLSAVQGDVRWLDRDGGQWLTSTAAQPLRNWPVSTGDRLRTGPDGRAEVRLGSATVRLGADAELWLEQVDDQGVVLLVQSGTVALRLAAVDNDAFGPVELATREGRWLPQRPGHYRIDRMSDATQATTWRGELRFEGRDSALLVPANRRADLWLDGTGRTRYAWAGVDRDGFADWVARDERNDDAPTTARYVPPGITGWQDLDRHGDWIDNPEHGPLWQPRVVAPGWAPFQDGRWAWVQPWGWTWIDASPWGFAPFHYGGWVMVSGRWCWSPGPRGNVHPHFAPALSAWIGGPRVGVTINIGGGRPPPPRVVMPVVVTRPIYQPVVVVPVRPRPEHRWEGHYRREVAPPQVLPAPAPRVPEPRRWDDVRPGDGRPQDGRREDRRDERRDERRDDRRDDRRRNDDHRGEAPVPPRPTVNVGARPPAVAAPAVTAGPVWHASEQPEPYRPPAGQSGLPTSLEQPQAQALPPAAPPPVPRAVPMVRPPESANRPAEAAVRAQPVVRPVAPAAAPVVATPAAPAAAAEPPQKARPAPIPRGPQDGEDRRDNRHENRSEKQRGHGPEDSRQAEARGGERANWR